MGAHERTVGDVVDLGPFRFERGGSVPSLEVAHETYGEFDGSNAVLICHGLTASARVASVDADRSPSGGESDQAYGWWDDVVGPGKAIDTTEYYVVCANVPGSCYGTTGPASTNPETGRPYGPDFPPVTVGDWTRAQRRLLDELGVERLHAVLGGSVGGMNALEWARRYPDAVERIGAVATGARLDPQLLALNAVARRAIAADPAWNGGRYYEDPPSEGDAASESDVPGPIDGLARARAIGHVTYLSKASMRRKFGRRPAERDPPERESTTRVASDAAAALPYREVESYLDHRGERFAERFDANSYRYLTRAMDDFDLAAGYDSDADALAGFDGEALVLSFSGDWHFPPEGGDALAGAFREAGADVVHRVVDSDHGHDAFLVEPESVGPPLAALLESGGRGRTGEDSDAAASPKVSNY